MDRQYWEEVLSDLDRMDDNSARRYRRYNKSLEAMGEKNVIRERSSQEDEFEAIISFIDSIENEKLVKALKRLKPVELEIITLRFVHKMQVAEIAKVLGKGVSTVSERLGRIVCKLIREVGE